MPSKELVAASARPVILAILARGESYGYAIIQEVRHLSGGEWEWTEGMLYPVLHRLQREGLIQSRWVASPQGRRRRYYRLRQGGSRALKEESRQWMLANSMLARLLEPKPCST